MLLVRICWGPARGRFAGSEGFHLGISNLFGISILGFRISRFGCGRRPR